MENENEEVQRTVHLCKTGMLGELETFESLIYHHGLGFVKALELMGYTREKLGEGGVEEAAVWRLTSQHPPIWQGKSAAGGTYEYAGNT